MFKRILAITAIFLCLSVPSYADNYLKFSGFTVLGADLDIKSTKGITDSVLTSFNAELQTDQGLGISLAVGIRSGDLFRAEIEYAYRTMDMDRAVAGLGTGGTDLNGDVTVSSWMVNFTRDFETIFELTPYVGFGAGFALHEGSLDKINNTPSSLRDGEDTTFAYQILLGAYYTVMEDIEAGLGYRYFSAGQPDYGFLKASVDTHNFELSLRYNF